MGDPQPQAPVDENYMTTGEVARILRVSPKTVARWAKEGRLPHLVTLGGHRRFSAQAIRDLAGRQQVAATDRQTF